MAQFGGVYVAIVTPFDVHGAVDLTRLADHADWLIRSGVHGLIPTGTCGEYASLADAEREAVIRAVAEAARGRVPLLVGVAAPTTERAVHWAEVAKSLGAQGIMALPPIGYRPTWAETVAYFRALGRVGLPIVVYNNPFDTAVDLTPARLAELAAEIPQLAAVKEFSGDVRRIPEILETTRLEVIAGADDLALEALTAGATGWIAGLANAVPEPSVELYRLIRERRLDEAWDLYRRLRPLFRHDSTPRLVQVIKYAMARRGHPVGDTRPPRLPLEPAERDAVDRDLARIG
jgi:4-hydroxy-tetrahydrodipicolinate synthase